MGFVYYANFFIYFERSRNEILRDLGIPYVELEERGVILPVLEAHCEYKTPAKYDDVLKIVGWGEIVGRRESSATLKFGGMESGLRRATPFMPA